MSGQSNELTFQNDMITQLLANGWLLCTPEGYKELTLLQERRTAIISAAVTGKIDVRSLKGEVRSLKREKDKSPH